MKIFLVGGKELRFTSASNAFSSLAFNIAGNGCKPAFSETPYLLGPGRYKDHELSNMVVQETNFDVN